MVSSCSSTCSASGWAKIVRIAAATISADPSGTWASTLRRKCTRHLCHEAPIRIASIALRRPLWASKITSCTPDGPRVFSDRRNAIPSPSCYFSETTLALQPCPDSGDQPVAAPCHHGMVEPAEPQTKSRHDLHHAAGHYRQPSRETEM